VWSFLPRLATKTLDWRSTLFYQQMGAVAVGVVVLASAKFKLGWEPRGVSWAMLTGACGVCGLLLYLQALTGTAGGGNTTGVMMISALYPVIGVGLATVVLREKVSASQVAGVVMAIAALALIARSD
jgi:uncharacterized membrane protein